MPKIYFPSQAEFEDIIERKFEKILSDKLPALIRKATQKQYFTISDACELLSCSRRHLLYLRQSGQINIVKNGKKIFFKREDLEAFFDDNYIETKARNSKLDPGEVNELKHLEILHEVEKNIEEKPNYSTMLQQITDAVQNELQSIGANKARQYFTHYQNEGYIKSHGKKYSKSRYYLINLRGKEINEIPGMENFVEWKKNNQLKN
jgi:excisionase family DNA binding protein